MNCDRIFLTSWLSVVLSGWLTLAGIVQAEPLVPKGGGNYAAGSAILERWLAVQGFDRPGEKVFPRSQDIEIKTGTSGVPIRLLQVSDGATGYWLNVQLPDGTRYIEFPRNNNTSWLVSESFGIGENPISESARNLLYRDQRKLLQSNYSTWQRLPDVEHKGKKYQVVALRHQAGIELRFFDPETGVLMRIGPPFDAPNAESTAITWSNFKEIDSALEPMEVTVGSGEQQVVQKTLRLVNRVALRKNAFSLPPKLYQTWQLTQRVLERYIDACGGKSAWSRLQSRSMMTRSEVSPSGVKYETILTQKMPAWVLVETHVEGIGREWYGSDGKTAWASSELLGFRKLRQEEREMFLRSYSLANTVDSFDSQYPFRLFRGEKIINGRKAVAIALASFDCEGGNSFF